MRTTGNRAKTLIITICGLMIAGCASTPTTIISSHDYRGDKDSFTAFKAKHGQTVWPEPETIAYFDPEGTNAHVIRYAHWAPPHGNDSGVVVHFNGRTEFIEKNIYTYKDLLDRGYEIWALDWRGQGFSQRQLSEKQKHDIDSFDTYIRDAAYFIDEIVKVKTSNAQKVLLAHSMGGQIALRYLLEHPDTFDYAVLSSPLLGLPVDGWYIRLGNWLKRNTFFADACVLGKSPAWRNSFKADTACRFAGEAFITNDDLEDFQKTKRYTNDFKKVAEIECLIESSIDANGQAKPDLRVACPTTRWLYEAFRSTEKVMQAAQELATPVLIVRTVEDTAVDNEAQKDFCDLSDKCELVDVTIVNNDQAGHELLVETEAIRKAFFEHFDAFVNR